MILGLIPHSFQSSFFSKTIRFPWVSGGFLKRRIPGKNGDGTPRNDSASKQENRTEQRKTTREQTAHALLLVTFYVRPSDQIEGALGVQMDNSIALATCFATAAGTHPKENRNKDTYGKAS